MTAFDRAPYPGLRAFKREETDLFFGRDGCIDSMIERLAATRFLAVLGSSGTGKSSLVRTGLLPGLEMGLLPGPGSRWWVVDFRPAGEPLRNLARRLIENRRAREGGEPAGEVSELDVNLLRARLARSSRSLIEWCREGHLPGGTNLLLLVDQFEELFRYEDYRGREEAEAFVTLLLESRQPTESAAPPSAELPIFVALTMRSEYLGACALIEGLAEAINEGTYLTPRMTRDECREAIVGPARVCGIEIEPALVTKLLNDMAAFAPWDDRNTAEQSSNAGKRDQLSRLARRADQLPLMQHALNQIWRETRDQVAASGLPGAHVTLTLDHYKAIGEVTGALDRHANRIFHDLGPQRAPAIEAVFRTLTSGTTVANAVRRPTLFGELVSICGGDETAVRDIVDAFRAPDCNFLLPEVDHKPVLDSDTRIDITHESLIRQWSMLSGWLEKEGRAAHDWQRLNEDAEGSELLIGLRLANAITLRDEMRPNAAWAARYDIDLHRIDALIDDSVVARDTEETARQERERQEQERRLRDAQELAAANQRIAYRTGAGLVAALALAVLAGWEWWNALDQTKVAQTQTQVAQTQTQRAEEQTRRAEDLAQQANVARAEAVQRQDEAVQAKSNALAALADRLINDGNAGSGALLALELADQRSMTEADEALVNGRLHLHELAVLPANRNDVQAAAFSPDGRLVVTASSDEAEIWEPETGRRLGTLSGHHGAINDARFSPDGRLIATASNDMSARIWDAQTARSLAVLTGHTGPVTTVAFSHDGKKVVSSSQDKTAVIWDVASGKLIATLSGHGDALNGATFSPNDKLVLTTSADTTARIWNAQTGMQVASLSHDGKVWQGAFSPDGKRIVTASDDETARLWDSATGRRITELKGHNGAVFSAEFVPGSDHVVTASYDQTARIWNGDNGASVAVLAGHRGAVRSARPSPDGGLIVTASTDGTARIWDARDGRLLATLAGHTNWVMNAVFSPDGRRIITTGRDRTARLWAADGRTITIPTNHKATHLSLFTAGMAPDGSRVAGPADNDNARIWNAQTGATIAVLRGHSNSVNSAEFDPSGRRVVTASTDRTARIWDAATGHTLVVLAGHDSAVAAAVFSPDGKKVVTGSADKTARIWDADTGALLATLSGHTGWVSKLAFSPDGQRVLSASATDDTVHIWDAETGKPVDPGTLGSGIAAAFSPDGKRVAGAYLAVDVFDAETGNYVAQNFGHAYFAERVMDLVYTRDGRYLLIGSLDGTARVWDAQSGRQVSVLTGLTGPVWSVAISADGRYLLTASGDTVRTLQVWDMGFDLRPALPRCLTFAERADFNLDPTPPDWCFHMEKWPYQSQAWKIWQKHKDDRENPPLPDKDAVEWLNWINKRAVESLARKAAGAEEALVYLGESARIYKEAADTNPDSVLWPDRLASTDELRAEALVNLSKRSEAIAAYRQALAVRMKLMMAEPDNTSRQSSLAFDYEKLAEQLLADDQNAEALSNARANLAIRRKLAAVEPGSADRQEGVAYALRVLGDVLVAAKNRTEAVAAYRESIAIRQSLADAEPGNIDRQVALAYVDEQLGEALTGNNVAQAIAAYQQALAIRRKLAGGQPDSADRQEDVAFDLRRLGDALAAGGDRHGALAAYRESIAIRQALAEAEAGNIDRQMALAYVDEHLAEALAADGNHPDAIAAYRQALGLRQKIAEADPSNASRQDDVSSDDEKLIKELLADGQNDEASSDARDNLAIQTKLAAAEPDSIEQQKKVASADEQLAIVLEAAGQYSDGLARRQDAFAILKSVAVRIESQETAAQGKAGRLTANELGSVAWYALFARDFEAALAAARRAADLAPDLLFVRTNLAHALMFLNRSDEAKDIYLEFRGAPLNGKTWEQVVLEDFTELRKAGLANPLMDVIEKTFAKNE